MQSSVHIGFWTRKAGPKSLVVILVVIVVVGISSLKIHKAFLMRSETLHIHSCWHFPQIYRLRLSTYFLLNE